YNNGDADDPNGTFYHEGLFEPNERWTSIDISLPSNSPFTDKSQILCDGGHVFQHCVVNTDSNGKPTDISFFGVDPASQAVIIVGGQRQLNPNAYTGVLEGFTLFVQLQDPNCTDQNNPVCKPWLTANGAGLQFAGVITSSTAPVPEPATLGFVALGLGILRRRKMWVRALSISRQVRQV